jgi:hypothetical protein
MEINRLRKDLLASTAVFAEMANNNTDLKQILIEFILSTYSLEKTFTQTANEVVEALSNHFEFEIPLAVVRTLMKKIKGDNLLTQIDGKFTISSEERKKWESFINKVEKKEIDQDKITQELVEYVEQQKGPLQQNEKAELLNCFTGYLFDESFEDNYSDLVSAFIINKSKIGDVSKELNLIREGITILRGIKYNPDINEVQSWRNQLTIYLDTEHLFNISGYNGEVYKKLIDDLLSIVKEINIEHQKKKSERAINFKFLEETELEVKSFFFAAKKIISGESNRRLSSVAMNNILNGASSVSDIIKKESEFFRALKLLGIIKEDPIELYENHRLNIEDPIIFKKYQDENREEEISAILKSFTAVNIKRKGNNRNSFENIGFIILTGSFLKLQISSDLNLKITDGDFSFATNVYYATNRLWFRLNRGLGFKSQLPTSLDVVAKAQMLLSSHLNSSVRDEYNKLENELETGNKTIEDVQDYYIKLRSSVVKPEEIVPENIEEKVKFLYDEKDMESFQEEQAILRKKAVAYDELIKTEQENKTKAIYEARLLLINDCKILRDAIARKKKAYRIISIIAIAICTVVIAAGIFSLITKNDTPLSIISLIIGLLFGIPSIVKRKKFLDFLDKKAQVKYKVFLEKNSIDESEVSTET